MRERVTFFHPVGNGVDPEALDIQDVGLLGPLTEAAREDRLTVAVDELPPDIAAALGDLAELHIHWTSTFKYDTVEPFSARLSPGFHVSYSSLDPTAHDPMRLCNALQIFGPLGCASAAVFTNTSEGSIPNHTFTYFYQELENVDSFIKTATTDLCPELDTLCRARIRGLYTIAGLDVSYQSMSRLLKITAFWPLREQHLAVPADPSRRRTEIGILSRTANSKLEANHVGVSGILTVLGEDKKPAPTLFDFPSRHWISDASFSSKFQTPAGLHPTLELRMSSNKAPLADEECTANAFLTLPKTIFADRYQLADELFLASKGLKALRYTTLPVDLEAPAYTTKTWGASILLELAPPAESPAGIEAWTAEIPLHLRYLRPTLSGHVETEIPYPVVFWACNSGKPTDSANPFDRAHLGYDDLFPPGTIFYHFSPKPENGSRLMSPIAVPVLREGAVPWVGLGTSAAVFVGFAWIFWKLLVGFMASGYEPSVARTRQSNKKAKSTKRTGKTKEG